MVKRRVGNVIIDNGEDWLRMRYSKGGVFEELYLDAEDGHVETVRKTTKGESPDITRIMVFLPSIVHTLEHDTMLKRFAPHIRSYCDERNPRIVAPVMPNMREGVIYHESAGRHARVFFFRSGNVYEEIEVRTNGDVLPMQLTYLRDRVLRLPKTLEMVDALAEFSTSMDINPELRQYTPLVEQYCRQQLQ